MRVVRPPYNVRQDIKPTKKSARISRRRLLSTVALLTVLVAYPLIIISRPVASLSSNVSLESKPSEFAQTIYWPADGQAAIGSLDGNINETYSSSEQQKPIASITKVITALAVLDKNPLSVGDQGETYIISAADYNLQAMYSAKLGTIMPVSQGQQLTQYQALQAMMLPSANNIADSLAIWTFGSMDQYLLYTNNFLVSKGLNHTKVADASGFSSNSTSTPSDLIKLGRLALQNEVLAEIVSQGTATIPGSGPLKNTNQLLKDNGVIGIKTGNTDEAGNCLLFAFKHGPMDEVMIAVVMAQPGWGKTYQAARQLRDSVLANFGQIELASGSSIVGQVRSEWGDRVNLVNSMPLEIYGWKPSVYDLEANLADIEAPLGAGQIVGKLSLKDDPATYVDIVTDSELSSPSLWWRLTHPF